MTTEQSPALYALGHVSTDRLPKATHALAEDAYLIRFTSRTDTEIRAFVLNGDATEYSVILTAGQAFCSCKDAMYRRETCKHACAVALFAIRTPVDDSQDVPAPAFNLKLGKVRAEWAGRSAV
jgi:predicted nucleic acid-binding Zn finger protein